MNKISIVAILLVVAIVTAGIGIFLARNVDGIAKEMFEGIGSQVTGSRVQVGDLQISLTEGVGLVSDLTVANPKGFSGGNLFAVGSIMVDIDIRSLVNSVYVIELISIDGARVLAEQEGRNSNIQALLDGMTTGAEANDASSEKVGGEILLAVKKVSFTNGSVQLKSDVFGETSITLPDFTVRDLGTSTDGMTPEQLGEAIAMQLAFQVKDEVVKELRELAKEAALDKLKEQISGKALEGLEDLKRLFGRDR